VDHCDNLFSHGTSRVESIQRRFQREEAKDHRGAESHLELAPLVHLLVKRVLLELTSDQRHPRTAHHHDPH
jgi:hypothetical protein